MTAFEHVGRIALFPLGAGVTVAVEQVDSDGDTISEATVALSAVAALRSLVALSPACSLVRIGLVAGAGFTANSGALLTGSALGAGAVLPTADTPTRVTTLRGVLEGGALQCA